MAIYIGNKTLNDVYIGNQSVKEIYLGSTLVWSKPSGSSLILTLDTSVVTQELYHYYIDIYVNGVYRDAVYFDADMAEALGGNYYFTNNQAIYPNVSDGDVITFSLWHVAGDDPLIQVKYNGVDINNASITINGQTNVPFVVTDAAPSGPCLMLNIDTSNITEDLTYYAILLYVNGEYVDDIFFDSSVCNDYGGTYYFKNNQAIYPNVSDGDVLNFIFYHVEGEDSFIQAKYNGIDVNEVSITINGPTEAKFTIVDSTNNPTLTINLNIDSLVGEDYLAYCIPFYVNGNYIDYIYFDSSGGDYYFDENLQFKYSNLSAGDVVTFDSAEHNAGDTPTIAVSYNHIDISNARIEVNESMAITFDVDPYYYMINNEIYIPYSEMDRVDTIRNIFSSGDNRYFDKVLTVTLTTNSGQYSYTQQYYQDDYDSEQPLIIVSNIGIPVSDIEHPDNGAKWTFSYFDAGKAEEITWTYPITFTRIGNDYVGYLE